MIDFQLELQLVALFQPAHTGAFHSRNMDKCIGLPIITLNEAKAFGAVEEFHCAGGLFSSQFPARRTATAAIVTGGSAAGLKIYKIAFDLNVRSGNLSAPVNQRKAQCLSFREAFKSRAFDLANMDKDVFAAAILDDEAEPLLYVEEFNRPGAFADNLVRHAATPSGTAGIAIRTCVSFYGWTAITLISIEVFVTEAVALVPASTSPVSVKTHS